MDGESDPLAALEADYAAVVAQTRATDTSSSSQPTGDAESAGSESDDEEGAAVGGFESYALLPSSPCNSDEASPDFENAANSEMDAEEHPQSETKNQEVSTNQEDAANSEMDAEERPQSETKNQEVSTKQEDTGGLEEDKRRTIMQSMRQVKLRPPPWAAAANLADDELLDLVQKQLGLKDPST